MKFAERFGYICFLIAASLSGAAAREITYQSFNCAITYPDGWQYETMVRKDCIAVAKDAGGLKSIVVQVKQGDPHSFSRMNEKFKDSSRMAIAASGEVLKNESSAMIDGIEVWEYEVKTQFEGRDVSSVSRIIIANGKLYKINTMYMEGDAASEPNLQACLKSFRFLHPPGAPPGPEFVPMILALLIVVVLGAWLTRVVIRSIRRAKAAGISD